jgi:hypothetical protein
MKKKNIKIRVEHVWWSKPVILASCKAENGRIMEWETPT